jgi:hypothetical protein
MLYSRQVDWGSYKELEKMICCVVHVFLDYPRGNIVRSVGSEFPDAFAVYYLGIDVALFE